MTKTAYNTPKKSRRLAGFLASIASAFFGAAVFSVIEAQRMDAYSLIVGFII